MRVVVYDSDGVNPYGRELANVLSATVATVTLICPRSVESFPAIPMRAVLGASPEKDGGMVRHAIRRVLAPLLVALWAILSRQVLVIAWTRDWYDTTVLASFSKLRLLRTVVVNHNPATIRKGTQRRRAHAEATLKRNATLTVVHSPALVDAALLESDHVHVTAHPPYACWAMQYGRPRTKRLEPTIAFLGALRPDKGASDFVAAVAQIPLRPLTVRFLGKGALHPKDEERLTQTGVTFEGPHSEFLADTVLGAALSECDLVIAPYRQVTQSGSVILALSVGVEVVAYSGGGLVHILDDDHLVAQGDVQGLATKATELLCRRDEVSETAVENLWNRALTDWNRVIGQL